MRSPLTLPWLPAPPRGAARSPRNGSFNALSRTRRSRTSRTTVPPLTTPTPYRYSIDGAAPSHICSVNRG